MATKGIYKLDDGNFHPNNCFPARSLLRPQSEKGAGHWEVARQVAERTKSEWLLGSKPTQITWRKQETLRGEKTLNRTLLMKLHCVKRPSDLCSVDISNQNLVSAQEEDFEQFDCVTYINATENLLTLEVFCKFPALRELDLSLNGLRSLKVSAGDFPHLEVLDLSYNNLSPKDIQVLGVLSHLKALHLTANGLSSLPLDLAVPNGNSPGGLMFPALEVLLLDDNHLSNPNVFASLANLRSLKQLNLERNGIREVPYLHYGENCRFSIHPLSAKSGIREGLHSRTSAEVRRKGDTFSRLSGLPGYVGIQSSKDSDRTEVPFQSSTSDASALGETPSAHPVSKISSNNLSQEFVLPFSKLQYLSLANNEIKHEEDLLAVALFPSLTELTFYGNPFTISRSGDPPLLTSFLQNKLGIKLVRKKISKLEKPRIFIPIKANRKVEARLPKVRKHPLMLEAPLETVETTFWQLWTGAETDLETEMSLDEPRPLPPITQFSEEKRSYESSQEVFESEYESMATLRTLDDMLELEPELQTSFDKLCEAPHEVPSLLTKVLLASLPPCSSSLGEQQGLAAPTESASAEQDVSQPPMPGQERTLSETNAPVGMPSTEQKLSGPAPSPGSSGQEANPSECSLPAGQPTAQEDPPQVLPPISSAAGELEPPPCRSQSQPRDQSEPTSPPRSSIEDQGLCKSPSPIRTPSTEQDQLESVPGTSSSLEEQALPKPVPPTGPPAGDQDLAEFLPPTAEQKGSEGSLPTELPPAEKDQTDSLPPAQANQTEELLTQFSSSQQEPARPQLEASSTSAHQGLEHDPAQVKALSKEQVFSELDLQVQMSSRHLHLLYQRELSLSSPSGGLSEKRSSSESLMAEEMEFFFMTQVEETSGPPENLESEKAPPKEESPEPEKKPQPVPKRYRGYEELLEGPTDLDFMEPRGIQQNVKALEWALQHPLVYRDPRARLDSFQQPYMPKKKKVLRVPVPSVQKTKAEKLEELLLQMRPATNIIEFPLVCALRRKKSNWREYREALGLLKEFTKKYKEAVATFCGADEAPVVQTKQSSGEAQVQDQPRGSLAGVRGSGPSSRVKFPPAQLSKEDKGL